MSIHRNFSAWALSASLFLFATAAVLLVIPESRAQVPMDLVAVPDQTPLQGYNPADPRFSNSQLCEDLGGKITDTGGGQQVCTDLDDSGSFCIIGSRDAFPCRGLFKHVIACNGGYNRPALNPFFCTRRCLDRVEKARGFRCEIAIQPSEALPEFQRTISYDSPPQFEGVIHTIAIQQRRRLYTLALPENPKWDGFTLNAIGVDWEIETTRALPVSQPMTVITIAAKVQCTGCYPEPVEIVATIQLEECPDSALSSSHTRENLNSRLWTAVDNNEWHRACQLIREGAGVNSLRSDKSLLHIAASERDGHMMKLLINKGAPLNIEDGNHGDTPLHVAVDSGSYQSDINLEVVKLLVVNGANIDAKNNRGVTPINSLLPTYKGYNNNIWDEQTILFLINKGVNLSKEHNGRSMLWGALGMEGRRCNSHASEGVIKAVLEKAPDDVTVRVNAGNCRPRPGLTGATPLHRMAQINLEDASIISMAIANGADVNATAFGNERYGHTPLHIAAASEESPTLAIKELIKYGASINATLSDGATPLHFTIPEKNNGSVSEIHLAKLKLLVENGAEVNSKDDNNNTLLHMAAEHNSLLGLDVVRFLVENGAELNVKSSPCEATPAYLAGKSGAIVIRDYLIRQGGEASKSDHYNCRRF